MNSLEEKLLPDFEDHETKKSLTEQRVWCHEIISWWITIYFCVELYHFIGYVTVIPFFIEDVTPIGKCTIYGSYALEGLASEVTCVAFKTYDGVGYFRYFAEWARNCVDEHELECNQRYLYELLYTTTRHLVASFSWYIIWNGFFIAMLFPIIKTPALGSYKLFALHVCGFVCSEMLYGTSADRVRAKESCGWFMKY